MPWVSMNSIGCLFDVGLLIPFLFDLRGVYLHGIVASIKDLFICSSRTPWLRWLDDASHCRGLTCWCCPIFLVVCQGGLMLIIAHSLASMISLILVVDPHSLDEMWITVDSFFRLFRWSLDRSGYGGVVAPVLGCWCSGWIYCSGWICWLPSILKCWKYNYSSAFLYH